MKLFKQFLMIQLIALVIILTMIIITLNFLEQDLDASIRKNQQVFQNSAERLFNSEIEPIVDFCLDYSLWDDTVNFVNSLDMMWAKKYLNISYFSNFNIDFLAVYTPEGYNIYADTKYDSLLQFLKNINAKKLFSHLEIGTPIYKYLSKINLVLVLVYSTIQPTDDEQRLTPPAGYLVMGMILSEEKFKKIQEILSSNVKIYTNLASFYIPKYDKFTLLYRKYLKDENGNNVAIFEVSRKSFGLLNIHNLIAKISLSFVFVVFIIFVLFTFFIISRTILPIQKITNGISKHNIQYFEKFFKRKDEIGQLAKTARDYIIQSDKIKQYVKELESKTEELKNVNMKIRKLLETDHLTNLLTRHVLAEQLDRLIKQSREKSIPLSVIFIDLDNFKNVNDTYNHLVGDQILKKIGEIINSSVRKSDFPIRYGGDEIIILLTNTPKKEAKMIAERIRKRIEDELFEKYGITASIGITQLKPEDDFESFITRVDDLVYKAKKAGKNQIFID
ncbi:sensor domain-containing diguanylate cyclase [Thermosipho atlanticus]|uniref:Diguanylate cyclase (GGDEF) domain-containing protein n=1 Tax=Thermosipho atlanticus DSM 15807 TaxID=1123380 RepID=A0A1M5U5Y8_9BACT|nr:diguanylate cyclase [Thermosipho atlanticus]SHH58417.1 diguanylate cyclase (GGDEF) domain-containing protein [Thermosipho atlanticus DSM 15807]